MEACPAGTSDNNRKCSISPERKDTTIFLYDAQTKSRKPMNSYSIVDYYEIL